MKQKNSLLPFRRSSLVIGMCMFAGSAYAMPTATGTTISWPDDGWYQVQTADGSASLCSGGSSCDVSPGTFLVINHSTGLRSEITVSGTSEPAPSAVTVSGNTIRWPDDGWYQLQTADGSRSVCEGGTSCDVDPGQYLLINHSTGQRFPIIEVSGGSTPVTPPVTPPMGVDSVTVEGTTISWPDNGWYQIQNAETFATICEGGLSCDVDPGNYFVINHSEGTRQTVRVAGGGTTPPVETASDSPVSAEILPIVFDIAGGQSFVVLSNAVQALVLSTDGPEYPLLSTTPGVDIGDFWPAVSDSRTYECPLSGTVTRTEHRREGYGFMTHLVADNCADSEKVANGRYQSGRTWLTDGREYVYGFDVSIAFDGGTSELRAERMTRSLPIDEPGNGYYVGDNISLIQNGVTTYQVGSLKTFDEYGAFIGNIIRSSSSGIATSVVDIDEIITTQDFRKDDGSDFFTTGSFVGNKDGVQVFMVDADTGNENTFSFILTTIDSVSSEIVNWSAYSQFDFFPSVE